MKNLLSVVAVLLFVSCTSRKSMPPASADTTVVASNSTTTTENAETKTSSNPSKTVVLNNPPTDIPPAPSKTDPTDKDKKETIPSCIRTMITKFKQEEVQNPPRKIYSYSYQGKTVYYVPAICCDFYSDLYDSNCKLIGNPDGGYTGRGDGKMTDFSKTRTNEKLIWEDSRKR